MNLVRTRWNSLKLTTWLRRAGTPIGAWPSSLFIWVCATTDPTRSIASHSFRHSEMLPPIDQPLDKPDDLRTAEMYVYSPYMYSSSDACSSVKTLRVGQVNAYFTLLNSSSLRLDREFFEQPHLKPIQILTPIFGCHCGRAQARERERSGRSRDGQECEALFGPNDCVSPSGGVSCGAGGKASQRVPEGRRAAALDAR